MFPFATADRMEGRQARWFRWMVLLSIAFHGVVLSLGSSALVSTNSAPRETVVSIELMEAPPPDPPAKPVVLKTIPTPGGGAPAAAVRAASGSRRSPQAPARRWLDKLDDPVAQRPAAGPRARAGQAALSARSPSSDPSTRPDDIAAPASRRHPRDLGQGLDDLERRVRARRSPTVLGGDGIEAGPVVNGVTAVAGDPIPAGVRNMIRDRVAAYLPELEAAYSSALRLNPDLKGKLVLRIRIDPRGNVSRAEPVEAAIQDKAFASAVVEKVRGWVFRPSAGFAIEVIYPFVFVAPS